MNDKITKTSLDLDNPEFQELKFIKLTRKGKTITFTIDEFWKILEENSNEN